MPGPSYIRGGIQFVVVLWAYYYYWFGTGQVLGCRRTLLLDVRTGGAGQWEYARNQWRERKTWNSYSTQVECFKWTHFGKSSEFSGGRHVKVLRCATANTTTTDYPIVPRHLLCTDDWHAGCWSVSRKWNFAKKGKVTRNWGILQGLWETSLIF